MFDFDGEVMKVVVMVTVMVRLIVTLVVIVLFVIVVMVIVVLVMSEYGDGSGIMLALMVRGYYGDDH